MTITKKNRRARLIMFFFFLSVFLYFIYQIIVGTFFNKPTTQLVQYGEVNKQGIYECILVRDEKVVKSPSEGAIKYFAEDGQKVEKGYKIAEIYIDTVSEEDKKDIEELSKRVKEINSNKTNLFEMDSEKINKEIDTIIREIKYNKKIENFKIISDLQERLSNAIEKKRIISGDKSFSGHNLKNIEEQKNNLESRLRDSVIEVFSPESGIISYNIDGTEEILTPNNMTNLTYNNINSLNINPTNLKLDKVIYDQPLFKVVDNTSWYLTAIADLTNAKNFKSGQKVQIDILDTRINGKVIDILLNDNKALIIIKTTEHNIKFYTERKLELNIINQQYSGLLINKDCIIEKEERLGVYTLDVNHRATFTPIKVKGYDDENVIVYDNFFYEKDGSDEKKISTLRLYDEILRNGKEHKEGEIIY